MTDRIKEIDAHVISACGDSFKRIDEISQYCTEKVLNAFSDERISEAHLHGSTGYGYTDIGRDALDKVYARAFECEDAPVSYTHLDVYKRQVVPSIKTASVLFSI